MNLFDLAAKLTLDSSEYEKGIASAEKGTKSLSESFKLSGQEAETNKNKIKVLTAQYESAKALVVALTDDFNNSVKATGAASEESQELAKKLADAEKEAGSLKGELDKLTDATEKTSNSFGKKLKTALKVGAAAAAAMGSAAVGMVTSIVKGTAAAAEHGDQIDKMSQKLGLSAEAYQKWDYVLGQAGADITSMSTGMKTLTNKLDDAKNGSADAQAMFAKLGLSMEDLNSMSREEVFENVIYGFQGMADSTERAALANDLFGKSGQELTPLFNESAESTRELMAAAEDLGFVMGEQAVKNAAHYHDALDTLQRTFGGLKTRLMGDFMPSLTSVMEGLSELFSGNGGLDKINIGISAFVSHLSDEMPRVLETGSQILLSLVGAITKNLPKLLSAATQAIITLATGLVEQLPLVIESGLQVLLALAQGIAESLPELIPTIIDVVLQIVDTLTQPDTLSALIDASIAIIIALANGLIDALPQLLERAPVIIGNLVDSIVQNAPKLLKAAFQLIVTLAKGIAQNLGQILAKGQEIVQKVISGIGQAISGLWSAGLDIVRGIWKGISDGFGWIKGKITGWVGDLLGFFKRLLGIKSPSKVFADQVGRFMAEGVGLGFLEAMPGVEKQMQDAMPDPSGLMGGMNFSVSGGARGRFDYELMALLRDIRDNMDTDLVLDDGTVIGWMDKALGRRATQRARGNA